VQVEHRCFALAPDPQAITRIFGSPERGKAEVLGHWAAAASHPGGEVINVELMRGRDFPYPYSMPGLKACKAAELQGGQDAHWAMFDRVQRAHAVEARNIADAAVLRECAGDVGLDPLRWWDDFLSPGVERAVWADIHTAEVWGVHAVPTVVFNDRWMLSGAVSAGLYRQTVEDLLAGRRPAAGRALV
jgi:predicted DsbA family dithiol-disulfide isomerase